jgi:hypothetical protein
MAKLVYTSAALKIPDGVDAGFERVTPSNTVLSTSMHGRFYELCRTNNLFWAGNMAGAAHAYSVALTATYTGVCISNPAGNNKDLVIEAFGFAAGLAYVALSNVGIMGGYSAAGVVTHTTPAVFGTDFGNLNLGSSTAPTALVDEHATIVNPRLLMVLGHEAIATAVGAGSTSFHDIGGAIRVQPGGWVATYCLTAITGNSCFWWSEEPR